MNHGHGSNVSYCQLLYRLEHVIDIERILNDHPSWGKGHRRDSHNLERVNSKNDEIQKQFPRDLKLIIGWNDRLNTPRNSLKMLQYMKVFHRTLLDSFDESNFDESESDDESSAIE